MDKYKYKYKYRYKYKYKYKYSNNYISPSSPSYLFPSRGDKCKHNYEYKFKNTLLKINTRNTSTGPVTNTESITNTGAKQIHTPIRI